MNSGEPRRFGLTHRQIAATVTVLVAAPFMVILIALAAWAHTSSTGMIALGLYVAAILAVVFGYQLVTGRDIAHLPPRRPPPRL